MQYFSATLNQTIILFVFILVGFIVRRAKILPDSSAGTISKLETYIFIPALIIHTFMTRFTVHNLESNRTAILWSVILLALAAVIGFSLSRIFSKDTYERHIYIYSLTIANFSFTGNAVVLGAFGEEMLFKYLLFTIPLSIFTYSVGVAMLKPDFKLSAKAFLNPVIFAMLIGAVLGLTGLGMKLPAVVSDSVSIAKNCMSPLAMILTGIVIADYKLPSLIKNPKVYICTVLRLIAIPTLFMLLLILFRVGNENDIMTLALLAYSMPLGLNTVVYPASYGADTKLGASMALISSTASIITIPLMFLIFI